MCPDSCVTLVPGSYLEAPAVALPARNANDWLKPTQRCLTLDARHGDFGHGLRKREQMRDTAIHRLAGKVIIVTGGTQGLGEGIARHLADLGAAGLVICGRNEKRGQAVAADLTAAGSRAVFVQGDLEQVEDCRRVVSRCDEEFGRLDGLVNAAANTNRGTLDSTTVEFWDKIMATNVRAPFILVQEAARVMKREKRGGSIVNILSMVSYGGQTHLMPYSVSKGALATLTKNAAIWLRRDRIRVNGLNIGWTATPAEHVIQTGEGQPENWLELADAKMPFGRISRPKDVAGITGYLLSDAAEVMTGSLVDFDQYVMGHLPGW